MPGLALSGRPEDRGDVVLTLDVGLVGEVEVTPIGLRFARERRFQIFVRLGALQIHCFLLSRWRGPSGRARPPRSEPTHSILRRRGPYVQLIVTIRRINDLYGNRRRSSIDPVVGGEREEFDEPIARHQLSDDAGSLVVTALREGRTQQVADPLEFLRHHRRRHLRGDLATVVQNALGRADPLPHLGAGISAVAASSMRLKIGTAPCPASQAPTYWIATLMLSRRPFSVIGRSGSNLSRSPALTVTSPRFLVAIWLAAGISRSNASFATPTSPGWATQAQSRPIVASRSLSALTFANASALAAWSFFTGICAAMAPIAWMSRR